MYVPFLLLSHKPNIRFRLAVAVRLARMFRPVEDQYLSGRAFGGNQIGVLRHVPSLVDFARVSYLLNDLYFRCRGDGVTTHFSPFIVPFEGDIALGEMDGRDLKVIRGLV